ncbi:ABC transporter permease [Herbiconiux sp. KACC 21604]|uniref:ABC transporter permease n=1 Tax=unclassified Herbiconiux TaxID=2618217 RepID=UPI0014916195|nr:ABC transporter permease [Herbiconiux sp. SALV-R1]QJU53847.1 ABC transporter permease [Herbiconiux sp. SALV-R1]WPO84859.1 ABC transporter permease [Herbiconiux sp. KACC 21604]
MVAEFLRLKFRLIGNAGRRSTPQLIGLIIGIAYAVIMAVLLVLVLAGLRDAEPEFARNVVVIGGSLVVAGFLLVPVVFSIRDSMDPRSFSLLGLTDSKIATALAVVAFVSVPSLVATVASFATVATWSRSPGLTALALVSAIVGAVTCVLGARLSVSLAAFAFATRRAREVGAATGVFAIILIVPAIVLLALTGWGDDGRGFFSSLSSVLSWTPLGAVWAVPADAANGQWVFAVLKLLIAAATLALIWLAWKGLVAVMTVTPGRSLEVREHSGLGWFGRTPTTPTGAIAARLLTYWARDPRYYAQLVIVPVVPVVAIIVFVFVGVPIEYTALLPVPVMCMFLGWVVHNDVAFDNTAIWLHVAAGRLGVADRIGRMIPIVFIAIPLIGIGSFLSVFFANELDALPAVLGTSTCLVLVGLGLGSIFSARFPYAATRPGDGAFTQPQSAGAAWVLSPGFSLLGTVLLSTPAIVYGVLGVFVDREYYWVSLWWGIGIGVVVLVAGVALGARIFNRRGPEILAAAQRN